jgi:hypothetical protein
MLKMLVMLIIMEISNKNFKKIVINQINIKDGKLNFKINDESYTVQDGVHFNLNVSNAINN